MEVLSWGDLVGDLVRDYIPISCFEIHCFSTVLCFREGGV